MDGRIFGTLALTGTTVSVSVMALIGLWRPPAAVPRLDGPGPLPALPGGPPSDLAVTVLLWAAMVIGAAGIGCGLVAVRRGWRPRPGRLLAGGVLAVSVLVVAPPMGSTDPMDYAVYGRMAVLGHDPNVLTPARFRLTGDPVGLLAPPEWANIPSVYGPLATATQWAASRLGGTSAVLTVLWLKVWNGLAFLAVALALTRLARPSPDRLIRVHLLWTLNPMMLWALIGGAHVDALAALFSVAALLSLTRGVSRTRGGSPSGTRHESTVWAGVLVGAAGAVKAPYVLVGAGVVWALRRSPRGLTKFALGLIPVLVVAYVVLAPEAIAAALRRGRQPSWNTPWELLALLGGRPGGMLLVAGSVALAGGAALVLLRGLPEGSEPWLRPAMAISLAWVLTTPVYYPWYEALIFPMLALAPASRLDWVQLARMLVATGGGLPGIVFRLGDSWLRSAVTNGPLSYVVPSALLILAVALLTGAYLRSRRSTDIQDRILVFT